MKKEYKISEEITVGDFLRRREGYSRRLLTRLKYGGLFVGERAVRTVDMLRVGDILTVISQDKSVQDANPALAVPIAYEDEDIIVFDKPHNMPVHPSHRHRGDTLGNFFSAHCPGLTFRPINRLDRDTSGLCAVAKNAHAAALMQGEIDKTYFAVVCGKMISGGRISAPIAREQESIIKRCVREDGQSAVTDYTIINGNERYTLLRIVLMTGRTHQIRVHMSHIGFPLAGDSLYGGDCRDIQRQALHCGEMSFAALNGERINLSSPIPQDMKNLTGE